MGKRKLGASETRVQQSKSAQEFQMVSNDVAKTSLFASNMAHILEEQIIIGNRTNHQSRRATDWRHSNVPETVRTQQSNRNSF
jgi:hypothetical protein